MIVLLTGAGGLIGRRLGRRLAEAGHEVRGLSRDPRAAAGRAPWAARLFPWSGAEGGIPGEALAGVDAIVHLAGESVSGRWTRERRRAIRASRVAGTRALVAAIEKRLDRSPATAAGGNGREDRDGGEGCKDGEDRDRGEGCKGREDRDRGEGCKGGEGWRGGEAAQTRRPGVLVSASAVGYYGDRGEEELDEEAPPGEGFLAEVCREWEAEARRAEALGWRVVRLRTGIVLDPRGGALAAMLPLYRAGLGGPLGAGRQWWPWIDARDLAALIAHLLERGATGAVNAVAPEPIRQRDFARALGRALRRPAFLPAPAPAVKALLGGFAGELLASRRVVPGAARRAGFAWRHGALAEALVDLIASRKDTP